jgi:tannase
MRFPSFLVAVSGAPALVTAASLTDVCTTAYIQLALPVAGFITGITLSTVSVAANAVRNYSIATSTVNPGANGLDFCNVTFSYSHTGRNDKVGLQ